MKPSLRLKLAAGCLLAVAGGTHAQEYPRYPFWPAGRAAVPPPQTIPPALPYVSTLSEGNAEAGAAPSPNGTAPEPAPCATCEPAPCATCEPDKEEKKNGRACDEGPSCLWNTGEPWTLSSWLLKDDSPYSFGGWVQPGYHTRSDGFWNNQPDRVNLHQLWGYIERKAQGKKDDVSQLDWGFRADLIYGIDGANTQSFGNRPGTWDFMNGWGNDPREALAMPQLYGELAYGDLSVIAGHFYTFNGYESVPAANNFFYSHAFTFNFSEPFTHTGVLGRWQATDKLLIHSGWVAGIDTGFDINMGGSAYHGGFRYNFTDDVAFQYMTCFGDLGAVGNGYMGTALLDVKFLKKFNWVLQNDVAHHDLPPGGGTNFESVGLVNYLFYDINDCWKLGGRAEWYRVEGVDYYEATFGLNFFPHANFRLRPEWRYQWSPEAQNGNNPLGIPVDIGIFGIDAIWTF